MNTIINSIALFLCTALSSLVAADSSNYKIVPFDYKRDGRKVLELLAQNADDFFVSSSKDTTNKNNSDAKGYINIRLENNTPLSDTPYAGSTYSRAILCIPNYHCTKCKGCNNLVGLIDFFIAEEDSTGRMETLCIAQGHALVACRTRLINYALQKLHSLGAQRVIIDVAENDSMSAKLFKALNFFSIAQNTSDKEYKVVRFARDISKGV